MCRKLLFFSAQFLLAAACFAQTNMVALYDQCNYSGRRYYLGVGTYRGYQMQIGNDKLSSFDIPYGLKITIYEHDKFEGRSNTYTASVPCLETAWRSMASSIVIERDQNVPPNAGYSDGVTFFNDCYTRGYSQTLRPGTYTGSQLGTLKYNISSFTINGDLRIKAYFNSENLGGVSTMFENNVSCLPSSQNDKIGSLVIEYKPSSYPTNPGTGSGQTYATLFAECNYEGNALRLRPGYYQGDKLGVLRYDISSIQLPSNLRAKVYLNNDNLSGSSYTITNDMSCLTSNMNDRIGSLVIEETGYTGGSGNPDPYERVVLYTDSDYKGQSVVLGTGTWYTMDQAGFPDNALSSIRIPAGYRVVLYEDANLRGSSKTLTSSTYNLSSGFGSWNDRVSSIAIYRD